MNNNNIYALVLVISVVIAIIFIMTIINNIRCNKYNPIKVNIILTTIVLFCLGITTYCYTNIKKAYKEVYYLEYTV